MSILQDIVSTGLTLSTAYFIAKKTFETLTQQTGAMSSTSEAEGAFTSPTRHDIYHVAFLLQQELPPELIPQILDYAEYWLKSTVSRSDYTEVTDIRPMSRRPNYNCAGMTYLSSLPIGEIPGEDENGIALVGTHPARKVVFTIESQDQGWSDTYREDQGSERNTWTWFETVVREASQATYQDVLRTQFEREAQMNGVRGAIPPPPRGREVSRNLHCLKKFQEYSRTWTINDEDEEARQWVQKLQRGQVIDLTVWARFVGWRNRVKSASIDVYTAAVR
jgi:hypothetical protein